MDISDNGRSCRISRLNGKNEIYDPVRRRFVSLTPEEAVRQTYLRYLIHDLHFPLISLSVEKKIKYNGLTKRYDILSVRPDSQMLLLVECKRESVKLGGNALYQAAIYNHELHSEYVVLFNGIEQYVFRRNNGDYEKLDSLSTYKELIQKQ